MVTAKNPANMDMRIHFARSRLLCLLGFFHVNKKDGALLWSAMSLIDNHHSETVHVHAFSDVFCPQYSWLFALMWNKYVWKPDEIRLKDKVVHHDEDEEVDEQELKKGFLASAEEKAKLELQRELDRLQRKERDDYNKNRPNYVDFFCFLLFFMSIPNDEMARWVFWLWFYIPKIKPNQERLHNLCNDFYKKEDPNKAWYSNEVRTIVKVVDDNFNAFSFQMVDQRTGGAWALQFHEMRKTITRNLGGTLFWTRLSKAFHFTIAEPSKYLHRLKDLRIRGSAPSLSRKGDRGDARHKIRDFVRKYFTYDRMPKENDSEFQGGGCLSTICNMISVGCSQMFSFLKKSQEQIGPEIDFTMGMGEGGYVRPSSRGTLAKLKNKIAEKEGKFIDEDGSIVSHRSKGSHDTHPDDVLEGFEDEEDEDELEEVIPLEYKYRVQLKLPARVLYNKAESIKGNSIDIMRKCDLEVIPEGEILDRLNIDFEALFADPDSMDNMSETKDDHEHIPSGITIRSDDDDESILSMDSAIRD